MLVLPSVVCATRVARDIAAATDALAITHQHGCLHVGDDLRHARDSLEGVGLNPNIGAVLLVGLGCETIAGESLAQAISSRRVNVDYVGIQRAGGTTAAIARGREIVEARLAELHREASGIFEPGRLLVGLDRSDDELVEPLVREMELRGAAVAVVDGARGGAAHLRLAALGAQLIVSLCGGHEAPLGFAGCPVVAVARDRETYTMLRDDFDLGAYGLPVGEQAALVADRVGDVCRGRLTASERRGSVDFVLDRLSVTM